MIMVGFFFEAYFLQCNSQNYIPYLCGFLLHPPFCSTITSEKSEFNFGCLLSSFFISHCNWKLLSRAQTQESFWVSNLKFPTQKLPFLKGKFSFCSYISKYKTGYSRLSFCSLNLKKNETSNGRYLSVIPCIYQCWCHRAYNLLYVFFARAFPYAFPQPTAG